MSKLIKGEVMISKELLSKVLDIDVRIGKYIVMDEDDEEKEYDMKIDTLGDGKTLRYWRYYHERDDGTHCTSIINIYELAHKCKEWAWDMYHVRLESGRLYGTIHERWNCIVDACNGNRFYFDGEFKRADADTEPEAIFKACEWILQQKESL